MKNKILSVILVAVLLAGFAVPVLAAPLDPAATATPDPVATLDPAATVTPDPAATATPEPTLEPTATPEPYTVWDKPIEQYTPTEGFLFILVCIGIVGCFCKILEVF